MNAGVASPSWKTAYGWNWPPAMFDVVSGGSTAA
jgi:hypothetical protein